MRVFFYSFAALACLSLIGCASYKSSLETYRGPGESVSRSVRVSGEFNLAWPVEKPQISQPYRPSRNRKHQGIDLRGPRGTSIRAAHEGRVIFAGRGFRGYGKMVIVEHSPSWASLYAHMHRIHVSEGQYVDLGDLIGAMGRTGRATGVHLHFELMRNKLPVDPLHYLPDMSRVAGK